MYDAHANHRGILLIIGASALFAANDAVSKLASAHMPVAQLMTLRGIPASILLLAILTARGQLRGLRHIANGRVLVRAGTESVSAFLYISALAYMALGDVSAIMQTSPLVTMAAAVLFLGMRIGWQRWLAVAAGFLGVLLVIKPGGSTFHLVALLPLTSAFMVSFRDFVTGRIASHVLTLVVTLATLSCGMLIGLAGSFFEPWQPLGLEGYGLVTLGGLTLVAGQMLSIAAFRASDPALISPFRYSNVPFAVFFGAMVFGSVPDLFSLFGMALIIIAGVYTVHNHRLRSNSAREALAAGALRSSESEALT